MERHCLVRRRTNCGGMMLPCRPATAKELIDTGTCHVIDLEPITIQYEKWPPFLVRANRIGAIAFWISAINLYRIILADAFVPFIHVSIYFRDIAWGLLFTFLSIILYVFTLEPESDETNRLPHWYL